MRHLLTAVVSATLLATSLMAATPPASAATTTSYGPISPTDDPSVNLTGTVSVQGSKLTLERVLTATEFKDSCFTAELRWTGTSLPASPASQCGDGAGSATIVTSLSPPPETIEVRACSGSDATLDESTCSAWTRVYTGTSTPPATARKWGPVRSKNGQATANGKITGSGLSAVLTDRSRAAATCGWALFTVTTAGATTKQSMRACNGYRTISRGFPDLTRATVKVCSGTKKKVSTKTCRSRRLV